MKRQRFQFVVKIHQALTLHADFRDFSETRQELFDAFKEMLAPLQESQN